MKMRGIDESESDPRKIAAALRRLFAAYTVPPDYTAAVLGDQAEGVNTYGKRTGKGVWDNTNSRPLWASGPDATDAWNDATGAAAITPS